MKESQVTKMYEAFLRKKVNEYFTWPVFESTHRKKLDKLKNEKSEDEINAGWENFVKEYTDKIANMDEQVFCRLNSKQAPAEYLAKRIKTRKNSQQKKQDRNKIPFSETRDNRDFNSKLHEYKFGQEQADNSALFQQIQDIYKSSKPHKNAHLFQDEQWFKCPLISKVDQNFYVLNIKPSVILGRRTKINQELEKSNVNILSSNLILAAIKLDENFTIAHKDLLNLFLCKYPGQIKYLDESQLHQDNLLKIHYLRRQEFSNKRVQGLQRGEVFLKKIYEEKSIAEILDGSEATKLPEKKISLKITPKTTTLPFRFIGNTLSFLPYILSCLQESNFFQEQIENVYSVNDGTGAVTLFLSQFFPKKKFIINDADPQYIKALQMIKDNPEEVLKRYQELEDQVFGSLEHPKDRKEGKSEFRKILASYNVETDPVVFIFLRNNSPKGLFHYNKRNKLVAYLAKENKIFADHFKARIVETSKILRQDNIKLSCQAIQELDFKPKSIVLISPLRKINKNNSDYQLLESNKLEKFIDLLSHKQTPFLLMISDNSKYRSRNWLCSTGAQSRNLFREVIFDSIESQKRKGSTRMVMYVSSSMQVNENFKENCNSETLNLINQLLIKERQGFPIIKIKTAEKIAMLYYEGSLIPGYEFSSQVEELFEKYHYFDAIRAGYCLDEFIQNNKQFLNDFIQRLGGSLADIDDMEESEYSDNEENLELSSDEIDTMIVESEVPVSSVVEAEILPGNNSDFESQKAKKQRLESGSSQTVFWQETSQKNNENQTENDKIKIIEIQKMDQQESMSKVMRISSILN